MGQSSRDMMLPLKPVTDQVKRMSGLDFFPQEPEARRELIELLAKRCAHVEHVRAVVTTWLEVHPAAPKPADLIPLIEQTAPKVAPRATPDCSACSGSGYMQVRRTKLVGQLGEQEYLAAKRCACVS